MGIRSWQVPSGLQHDGRTRESEADIEGEGAGVTFTSQGDPSLPQRNASWKVSVTWKIAFDNTDMPK